MDRRFTGLSATVLYGNKYHLAADKNINFLLLLSKIVARADKPGPFAIY